MAKTTKPPKAAHAKREKRGRHELADGGTLTPRQAAFVQAYAVGDKTATQAAIDAGYSAKSARAQTYDLLRHPGVKAELDRIRERITEKTVYDAAAAFNEAGEGIELARKSGNAHALVKAVELRARLHGLLTDKLQVESVTVDLIGALRDAKARLHPAFPQVPRPMCDPAPAIDAEFAALPKPCDARPIDNQSIGPVLDLAAARSRADRGADETPSTRVVPLPPIFE